MFAGPVFLCLLTSLISVEQFSVESGKPDTNEVHVTLQLKGDRASRYLELIKSPEVAASFNETGNLLLRGVAMKIDENHFRVRHTAIVRIVGRPLEQLFVESEVSSALIASDRPALATDKEASHELVVQLSDVHPVSIQVRKLVGGFPDGARYH